MLEGLKAALDATGYDFVFAAWRRPPDGADYGVYFLDGQEAFASGAGPASEKMLTGYIDFYTKDTSETLKNDIETALNSLGIFWEFESAELENESGYLHYEWTWVDSNGKVRI